MRPVCVRPALLPPRRTASMQLSLLALPGRRRARPVLTVIGAVTTVVSAVIAVTGAVIAVTGGWVGGG